MELKEFVSKAIQDIVASVDEASNLSNRKIGFIYRNEKRTIEFDIAVSVEESETASGKAGIRVLQFVEAGGDLAKSSKNATVSRIQFGVDVSGSTKAEEANQQRLRDNYHRNISRDSME